MPPKEGVAAFKQGSDSSFASRLESALAFLEAKVEPGEPRLFRKVNLSKFEVIPLDIPEKMQMLVDECEKYLALPLWTDKFGNNHEKVRDTDEPGRRDWRNDPASAEKYGKDVMQTLTYENRIMLTKMSNIQILARRLEDALQGTAISSPDIERIKAVITALNRAFDIRPAKEGELAGLSERAQKMHRESAIGLFNREYNTWPNEDSEKQKGKVTFVREFSRKIHDYLEAATGVA